MGRFSGFLRLCAILFVSFFVVDAFGAGYTCPSYKQYTSCNAGYYLSGTGVGNSCVICPVGSYCPGGTYTVPHDCDSGSTTASSSNIWTTGGTGKTARSQCYRNVVISRKYNGGNSSATGTLNVLNPVTGVTTAWSSGDLTIQVYYNTAFTLPASSGLTFDVGSWYEFGGWVLSPANSTYGSSSNSTAVTFMNTSTAASQTYYPVIKAKSTITLDCQGCDTPGTASLYAIHANGMYLDSAYTKKMGPSANPITIPVKMGYNFAGYYKNSGCSGNQIIGANGYFVTDPRVYADTTLYACWTAKSYTCSAGTYLPAGATACATCVAGYSCPGGSYVFNPNANSGMYECTGYTYSAAGASACSTTSSGYYATGGTTCTNNGTRCTGQTICEGGYYCTNGQRHVCPDPKSAVRTAAFPDAYNANNSTGVTISLSNVNLNSFSLVKIAGLSAVTGCQALYFWKPNGAPAGLYEYVHYDESTGKYESTSASDSGWAYYYVNPGYQLTTPANNGVCYGGQRYYKAVQKCPTNYYCNHEGNMSCTNGETYTDALPNTKCSSLTASGFYSQTDSTGASTPDQCFGWATPGITVLTKYADPEDCPVGSYCLGGEYPEGGYGADEKIYYGSLSASTAECPDGFTSDIAATSLSSCYCTTVLDKNGLYGTIFGVAGTTNVTKKLNYGVANSLPKASTLVAENATFLGKWSTTKPMPQSAYSLAKVPNQMTSIKVGDEGCPARLYAVKQGVDITVDFFTGVSGCEMVTLECYANSGECILPEISCSKAGYVFAGWMNTGDNCDGGYLGNVYQPGDDVSTVGGSCVSSYSLEFTAQWLENGVTCAPGYYAKAGESTCNNKCGYGYYCPGGGGTTAGGDFGRNSCSSKFAPEAGTDESLFSISSDSNISSLETQCYVESASGYRIIPLGYTDDGLAGFTVDLSPANYAWYQDRLYYGANNVVLSNAMTCADDLGSDRFVYSEPGSNGACYALITLDKNGGSGTVSTVQRVYNDSADNRFPATTPLSSSIYNFTNQWGTDSECSGTTYTPGTDYYFYAGGSVPEKLYACRTAKKFTCTAGTYLPMGKTTCATCVAGYFCPGVQNVVYNESKDQGISACPEYFTSDAGATSQGTMGLEDENVCYISLAPGYAVSVDQANGYVTVGACDSNEAIIRDATMYGMDMGYYCPGGDKIKYQGAGLTGFVMCPPNFDDAPSTISSRDQCAFTLQPGDSIDNCDYTFVSTVGSCVAGDMSYFCPGYTVTLGEVNAEEEISWCGKDNYMGSIKCPANSTASADQTHCTCNYGYQVSDGAATITNDTQTCVPVSVTVSAGYYLPAGSLTSAECGASDAYCPGATCSFSTTMDCGRESCPDPKEDESFQADNVDWVDSAKLPDERKKTSVGKEATLKTWRKNLKSINQCFVTYTIQNDAGTMLLESIYYDSDSGQYTDAGALTPYYTQLNPGYYLHTRYSATYCSAGNANAMYYQFAEKCPENYYCPGLASMPKCDDANYTYGEEMGKYECLIATAGYYPWSAEKSSSVGQCYLNTLAGEYVAEPGAGTVTCLAGSYCPGGAQIYYNDGGAGYSVGGIESCPSSYPESAPGNSESGLCYVELEPGEYVAGQGTGATLCPSTDYCLGGKKIYLFISDGGSDEYPEYGGNYPCPNGYLDNTDLGKELIRQCLMDVPGGYYVAESGATQYVATDPGYYQPTPHSVGYGETSVEVLGYEYIACSGQDKYQNLTAQTECKTATDGFYTTKDGEICSDGVACTGQTECEIGHYCTAGVRNACDGTDKYQGLTGQASCNTVSWGYYTTKDGELCADSEGNGSACTGQTQCEGGYYCTARTGVRKACPDAQTHKRTTQFTSTNSNLIMPTVTLDMLEELTNTSVTARTLVGDITGCQVLSWYTAKPVDQGGKASLYEYAMYVGDEENGEYSNTSGWGYMSVQPGYYLSDPSSCGAYAYYHVLNECESGQYCPGKDSVACNSSNQATVHTETFGVESCPTNYGASPARATAENQCYLTTTAGTYVAEPYAAPVTCPGGSWCPSVRVNYGETGGINACPVPSEHAMTTFPSSWYPVWQDGYAPGSQIMSVRDVSQQTWTEGIGSIDGCRANYFMTNDAGDFNVESVMYNSSTGIYETQTSNPYYGVVKPGFYLKTRYTENYCDGTSATADKSMYYQTAVLCPANSVCPGFTSMPMCSSGKYNDTLGIEPCTAYLGGTYPYSDVGSDSYKACYTVVPAGHYVYKDENDYAVFEECPQGTYSGGNGKYYAAYNVSYSCDSCATNTSLTGGTYSFTEGTGATKIEQCYEAVPAGYYIREQYGAPEKCPYASYSEQKKIVFYGETTQCDQCTNAPENAEYDVSVSGWTNANCPWECNDGYNQTVDANGNPMCGQMCTVPGMNYIKSSTGLSIPLYSSKGTGWARAIGVSLDGGQTACYGRLEQDTGNAPSGSLRVNVGGTKYYAVE